MMSAARHKVWRYVFAGLVTVALSAATVVFTGCPEEPVEPVTPEDPIEPVEPEEPEDPVEPDLPDPEEDEPMEMPDPDA